MTTKTEVSNRWDPSLAAHADEINRISGAPYLWHLTALLVEQHYRQGDVVLELGCGPGDSTVPVITRPFVEQMSVAQFHILDCSSEAIRACKMIIPERYRILTSFFEEDALDHLLNKLQAFEYGVVYSAWTVHNFSWDYKRALFKLVHKHLRPGGVFILMDKVYPDDKEHANAMINHQLRRYKLCLPADVAKAISYHETEDYGSRYRMDEGELTDALHDNGFSEVRVVDRVERDCVIVCTK
jgi:SAM-dependent methyltransferase